MNCFDICAENRRCRRAALGRPVLNDDTLRWVRQDGTPSRIAVSGVAAQQVLGPFAHNVIGARRAGELIAGFLDPELAVENAKIVR